MSGVRGVRHDPDASPLIAAGRQRFFFVDRGEENSYALVVRGTEQNQTATAIRFAELLRLFKFFIEKSATY